MRKFLLMLFIIFGFVFAETPIVGNAYVISALGIKNSPNDVDYVSGDTSVSGNTNYVLSPQVIIYQEGLSYVGSYTPFTGCLSSQHYTNGAPDGMCITGIINDLTTGGIDKALSAEQGKILDNKISKIKNLTRINLLKPTASSKEMSGITMTNNGDGTYTFNGTNTDSDEAMFKLTGWLKNDFGGMRLVGSPVDETKYGYRLTATYLTSDGTWDGGSLDYGDGVILDGNHDLIEVSFVVQPGITCNNLIVKPMITPDQNATYSDFVSYDNSVAINKNIINDTNNTLKYSLYRGWSEPYMYSIANVGFTEGATITLTNSEQMVFIFGSGHSQSCYATMLGGSQVHDYSFGKDELVSSEKNGNVIKLKWPSWFRGVMLSYLPFTVS